MMMMMMIIIIIIIIIPRYQGSRGVSKKLEENFGVTITPGSPQTQRNRVAARR